MESNATYVNDVTYRNVREALIVINENLRGRDLDPKVTFRLSNNRLELEDANEKFEAAVEELEKNHLEYDENDQPKTKTKEVPDGTGGTRKQQAKVYKDKQEFLEAVEDLLDEEVASGLRMENISYDAFGAISEETLTVLRRLFLTLPERDDSQKDTSQNDVEGGESSESAEQVVQKELIGEIPVEHQ